MGHEDPPGEKLTITGQQPLGQEGPRDRGRGRLKDAQHASRQEDVNNCHINADFTSKSFRFTWSPTFSLKTYKRTLPVLYKLKMPCDVHGIYPTISCLRSASAGSSAGPRNVNTSKRPPLLSKMDIPGTITF